MTLCFKQGKQTKKVKYLLKDRDMAGDKRMGFSNADVLYMLMPDRFANGNPHNDAFKTMRDKTCDRTAPSLRHGGDMEGIRQHLDYFKDLGVTALWFTPLLENDGPNDGAHSTYHATPPPTTTGWTRDSAPTKSISGSSTRPTARV